MRSDEREARAIRKVAAARPRTHERALKALDVLAGLAKEHPEMFPEFRGVKQLRKVLLGRELPSSLRRAPMTKTITALQEESMQDAIVEKAARRAAKKAAKRALKKALRKQLGAEKGTSLKKAAYALGVTKVHETGMTKQQKVEFRRAIVAKASESGGAGRDRGQGPDDVRIAELRKSATNSDPIAAHRAQVELDELVRKGMRESLARPIVSSGWGFDPPGVRPTRAS